MITKAYRKAYYWANRKRIATNNKKWYDRNRDHALVVKRESHLRRRYSISKEWYIKQLELQKGRCAICDSLPTFRKLDIDHDHTSKVIRGLLCHLCNVMLGSARDNPKILEDAAIYLLQRG